VSPPGGGALPSTASVVDHVIAGALRAAERASGLAETLRSDATTLQANLGGGPPAPVREVGVTARAAADAFDRAAADLAAAVGALQAFTARHT
jgi:hypothetical protein